MADSFSVSNFSPTALGIVTEDLIMHGDGIFIGQRFAQCQLECRKTFVSQLLRKLNDAGLTDASFFCQLL